MSEQDETARGAAARLAALPKARAAAAAARAANRPRRCGDCWKSELDQNIRQLRCHGNPPVIKFPYEEMRVWPVVTPDDWCAHFEPRLNDKTTT